MAGSFLKHAGLAAALAVTAAALFTAPHKLVAQPVVDRDYSVTWLAGFNGQIPAGAKLRFGANGRFTGFGGCNQLNGGSTQSGDALALSSPARTRAMCPPPVMAFEDAFVAAIAKGSVRQVGDELVLSADGQRLVVLK